MNIGSLKEPIDNKLPCGDNIRTNASFREVYYRLKDARSAARSSERGVTPGESISISPAWQDVNNLGLQVLTSMSKDLEVLAWLMEAQLRLRGFAGLRDVYIVTASLLEQYFDDLYSIGDDDLEERFAPFAGLNGIGGEGTLIQAIRLTSLIPGGKFGQMSLWDFQLSQRPGEERRREDLQQAASDVSVAHMTEHANIAKDCITAFDRVVSILAERCGQEAPPSSNTRNALQEAATAIRFLARIEDAPIVSPTSEAVMDAAVHSSEIQEKPATSATRPFNADDIRTREEAFDIMLGVARYFRRAEPHSPISMSIETLVRRGRMDFSELLAELLPEASTRNAVLTAAGIKLPGEANRT